MECLIVRSDVKAFTAALLSQNRSWEEKKRKGRSDKEENHGGTTVRRKPIRELRRGGKSEREEEPGGGTTKGSGRPGAARHGGTEEEVISLISREDSLLWRRSGSLWRRRDVTAAPRLYLAAQPDTAVRDGRDRRDPHTTTGS